MKANRKKPLKARTMVQMSEKGPFPTHRGCWHREKYSLSSWALYGMFDLQAQSLEAANCDLKF